MDLAWANLQHMALFCSYMSEKLHFAQIVLMLRKPSLAHGWKGDEQARSIIGVTLAHQYCGHWRQTCKNCRRSLVFFQSGRGLLKSLIDSQHLKQSRSKEKIFLPSRPSHLRSSSCWVNGLERVRLEFKRNQTKGRGIWMTPTWYSRGWGFSSLSRFGAGEISANRQQSQLALCKQRAGECKSSTESVHQQFRSGCSSCGMVARNPGCNVSTCVRKFAWPDWRKQLEERMLGLWILKRTRSRQETRKVTCSFDPDWSDWPTLREMRLVAALLWPKCRFCSN